MPLRLMFLAAVLIVGRPVTAWPQDWQMFATVGVGAQLVCSSGDPTRLDYQLEGSLGGLLEFTGTGLAAGAQADICTLDGPDARLGPVVEFRVPWRRRRLQPFAQLGYFANNLGGTSANGERAVVGAGIDILRANGADIRVSIQDAFRRALWLDERVGCSPCTVPIRPEPWFRHELSFQVGLIWK